MIALSKITYLAKACVVSMQAWDERERIVLHSTPIPIGRIAGICYKGRRFPLFSNYPRV